MKISIGEKTMDKILIIMYITLLIFTIIMIALYILTGGIPDNLCICFYGAFTGECGFMGWIKTAKVRYKEHQWDNEYEERQRELMKNNQF